ncbi:MAG: hypothetical protein ACE5KU_05395 [Nitrososphaerales archaeon]
MKLLHSKITATSDIGRYGARSLSKMPEGGGVFTALGIMFILLGIALVIIPAVVRYLPSKDFLDRIPWIILYVYRQDNFTFVTSPLLILISLAFILYALLR